MRGKLRSQGTRIVVCEVVQSYNIKHGKIYKEQFTLSFELYFMYNTTFYNATLNLYKQTTSFQRQLMAVLKRQNKAPYSTQAKNTTKLSVSVYY